MTQSLLKTTLLPACIAAIVSGAAVYGGLTLLQQNPGTGGAEFEASVHDYLVTHPQILMEMQTALLQQRDAEEQAARHAALTSVGMDALVDPMVAYVEGPADAKVTVAEFFDYRCGFCKATLPAIKAVVAAHPEVRFAFIEYPILTQDSLVAAHAAVAARKQPGLYLPFHLALMETQGELPLERILSIAESVGLNVEQLQADMSDPSVLASLEASRALAESLHVGGTPSFVINGKFTAGQMTEEELASQIAEANG
ncbi:MAG: hypothetical protein RJB62_1510 [Pseudomonadota bacterium]|jgi:protein-disulfide isomerase